MSLFLLDTDTLSLLQQGQATVLQKVNIHPISDMAVSTITIQEQTLGFLAALGRARNHQQIAQAHDMLATRLLPVWSRFRVLPFLEPVILRFEQLRSMKLNVGLMDLRIAATALENGLTVISRNLRDFKRVPGLRVEDWSV